MFRLSNQARVDEHIAGGHADHDDDATPDEDVAEMDHDDTDGHHEEEASHEEEEASHEEEEASHEEEEASHEEEGHEVDDAVLVLGPGETGTLVFTFPENDHDFTAAVCLIPGHYEAGMAADLHYEA